MRNTKYNTTSSPYSLSFASPSIEHPRSRWGRPGDGGGVASKNSNGFTLVELIVVVTILAILATIGFVSYSSYLIGVRDTNRIAQMTSLSDGLNLYSTTNDLPIPEDNVEVTTGTDLVAYQGYAGANILETINFDKGGLDPKDNTYFSYYLTRDRKYFQLMGFLEESVDLTTQSPHLTSPNGRGTINSLLSLGEGLGMRAYAANFQDRIPTVSGKKLGILTDLENTPIQDLGADVDIGGTGESYKSYFTSGEELEGDSSILSVLADVAKTGGRGYSVQNNTVSYTNPDKNIPREGLLLELLFNGDARDNTGQNLDGIESGGVNYIEGIDKIGNNQGQSVSFDGTSGHITVPHSSVLEKQGDSFAWSFWFKTSGDQLGLYSRQLVYGDTLSSLGSTGDHNFRNWINSNSSRSWEITKLGLNDDKWHHVIFQWNGTDITTYVDNILLGTVPKGGTLTDNTSATFRISTGGDPFLGAIDNVRVYDDVLNQGEIENLYNERDF